MPDFFVIPDEGKSWTAAPSPSSLCDMIYQHPLSLTERELRPIIDQSHKSPFDIAQGLLAGAYQIYRVGSILTMVSVISNRLIIHALVQEGKTGQDWRKFVAALKLLGREWGVEAIETTAFNERHKRLTELTGAKVDSWNMVMEV